MDLKVVVTGTGRCGTNFMANLLTSLGIPCGHEAVFGPEGWDWASEVIRGERPAVNSGISRDGTILSEGMELEGDSSYAAAPFLGRFDAFVIHLVRNPLNVVASMTGSGFRNFAEPFPVHYEDMPDHLAHERFLYQHIPELAEDMPQLDRACLFYLRWNEMIESSGRVGLFHRVEDPVDPITRRFGTSDDAYGDRSCNSFADTSRAWRTSDVSDPYIKRGIREIMRRYGYKDPDII